MAKKLTNKTLTFNWQRNQVGCGQNCTYFPFMKLYIYSDTFDKKKTITVKNEDGEEVKQKITEEIVGWKFMAYFCDNSYHSHNIYETAKDAKHDAERYCLHLFDILVKKLDQEEKNEYPEVQCETGEKNSEGLKREAAIK